MENTPQKIADTYQQFFDFMVQEHNLFLTKGEMDDIIYEAQKFVEKYNES